MLINFINTLHLFLITIFLQYNDGAVRLDNPSFEGSAQDATTPVGWFACGESSTPDILPGVWGVYKEPADGDTFLGLITREDGTWEAIGQKLRQPLIENECYTFSIDLARSTTYAGYDIPVKFQMWGAENKCSRQQLLAETSVVRHTNWKTYNFEFTTKKQINYIIIEAKFANGIYFAYKGNLLLDHCSKFKKCIRA